MLLYKRVFSCFKITELKAQPTSTMQKELGSSVNSNSVKCSYSLSLMNVFLSAHFLIKKHSYCKHFD